MAALERSWRTRCLLRYYYYLYFSSSRPLVELGHHLISVSYVVKASARTYRPATPACRSFIFIVVRGVVVCWSFILVLPLSLGKAAWYFKDTHLNL